MQELMSSHKELWQVAVQHPLVMELSQDRLSMEQFKDAVTQIKYVSDVGVRGLLCSILAKLDVHHSSTGKILKYLQSFHPGGSHFEGVNEILRNLGGADLDPSNVIFPTEAMCNHMHKLSVVGSLKEQLLVLATLVEVVNSRLQMIAQNTSPSNPILAMYFQRHAKAVVEGGTDWIHEALDRANEGGSTTPTTKDKHIFKRTLQWMVLINDGCMQRGLSEWPLTPHYQKAVEVSGRSVGA